MAIINPLHNEKGFDKAIPNHPFGPWLYIYCRRWLRALLDLLHFAKVWF